MNLQNAFLIPNLTNRKMYVRDWPTGSVDSLKVPSPVSQEAPSTESKSC